MTFQRSNPINQDIVAISPAVGNNSPIIVAAHAINEAKPSEAGVFAIFSAYE